jgi:hypothetical protein
MDKIPYILYTSLEEMTQADETLSSLYGSTRMYDVKHAYEVGDRRSGYVVIRDGVNRFGLSVPWGGADNKNAYVEVKLVVDLEND